MADDAAIAKRQSLPGFESPAVGFDQPFEMLGACHDRVRRSLQLLERLVPHLAGGVDAAARQAAADILRYFELAAPAHHEDEERHVVPVLRASGDPALQHAADRLLADHAAIRIAWVALAPQLQRVAQGHPADAHLLADAAARFVALHAGHLALEESIAFPAAQRWHAAQGPAALAQVGTEMAGRRRPPRAAG